MMAIYVLAALTLGCQSRLPPAPSSGYPLSAGPPLGTHRIWGQVVLNGQPVPNFGLTLTGHRSAAHYFARPIPVRDEQGRFSIEVPTHGYWQLIVSGTGFARHLLDSVSIKGPKLTTARLVRIEVTRGYVVAGNVTDTSGRPIAGAVVTMSQSPPARLKDALWEISRGNISATTDRDGRYRLDDISVVAPYGRISASAPDLASVPIRSRTDQNAVIDLVLLPVGTVKVALREQDVSGTIVAQRVNESTKLSPFFFVDNTFEFTNIPIGEYEICLMRNEYPYDLIYRHRVLVMKGQTSELALP